LIACLDLNKFHTGAADLVIERIPMRLLNDDLGFHAGQIRKLLDQALVVAREYTGVSGLNRGCGTAGYNRSIPLG
jgi:hypothetical protein